MSPHVRLRSPLLIPFAFVVIKVLLHLGMANNLGFHRDEFLYLALGGHPALGYWSNAPLIGWLSWLQQGVLGGSLLATRVLPALFGAGTLWLVGLMVQQLGGRYWAQLFAGAGMLASIAWLRSASMFMPVVIDIFFWTLALYCLLQYLQNGRLRWALWLGVAVGFGMLNKYSVLFLGAGLLLALLLTPQRKLLFSRHAILAVLVALVLMLPNIVWQYLHHFPVLGHMRQLARTQLAMVNPVNYLIDQLLMHGAALLIWAPGLLWLLQPAQRKIRPLGYFFVCIILLFLAMSGKSYYTLGAYPVLFAAGGMFWEGLFRKIANSVYRTALSTVLPVLILLGAWFLLPVALPVYGAERLAAYFKKLGVEAVLRWERGNVEALPQDYADMLGWNELAALADSAAAGVDGPVMIYGENYGEAGAIRHLSAAVQSGQATVVSFSDSFLLWAPDTAPEGVRAFIYVNDELGADIQQVFEDIRLVGKITSPLARERGTGVWVCRTGDLQKFRALWTKRVHQVRSEAGLE